MLYYRSYKHFCRFGWRFYVMRNKIVSKILMYLVFGLIFCALCYADLRLRHLDNRIIWGFVRYVLIMINTSVLMICVFPSYMDKLKSSIRNFIHIIFSVCGSFVIMNVFWFLIFFIIIAPLTNGEL